MVDEGLTAGRGAAPLLVRRLARAWSCTSRDRPRRAQAALRPRPSAAAPTCSPRSTRCSPTALIGVSGSRRNLHAAECVEAMARAQRSGRSSSRSRTRPRKAECTAEEAYALDRRPRHLRQRQPVRSGGTATGTTLRAPARATTPTSSPASASASSPARRARVTDEMFLAAARTLADRSPRPTSSKAASTRRSRIREVSAPSPPRSPRWPMHAASPRSRVRPISGRMSGQACTAAVPEPRLIWAARRTAGRLPGFARDRFELRRGVPICGYAPMRRCGWARSSARTCHRARPWPGCSCRARRSNGSCGGIRSRSRTSRA